MNKFEMGMGTPEMGTPEEENPEEENEVRISFLKSKEELSPAEEAELKARRETGDARIAFLESKKAGGEELSPAEEAELKARREKLENSNKIHQPKEISGYFT